MRKIFFILICAMLVFSGAGCVKIGDGVSLENSVPTISVTGNGKIEVVPDEAVAAFGVTSEERSLSRAYEGNTRSMNTVIAAVKFLGIGAKDIRTSSYSVTPIYPRDEKGYQIPGKPATYRVSQQLTVKIRDISKAGEVIDKAMSSGADTFNGIWFDSSKIEDIRIQAKAAAAEDARSKAGVLAESLGVKAGRVLKVDESSGPVDYGAAPRKMMAFAENAAAAPSIEAGSMEVTATCNVIYEIVQ